MLRARSRARCPAGGSRRCGVVRLLALMTAMLGLAHVPAVGFSAACSARRDSHAAVRMRAGSGFSYGSSKGNSKGFAEDAGAGDGKKKKKKQSAKSDKESSSKIVKDERSGKSAALTNTKLTDLRDKTLALRMKREAELDEYEEGRALIAKYGPKAAVMPEKVAQRSAKRGMVVGGTFYAAMLAVFAFGIFLYKTQDLIIPPSMMAFVTLFILGLAIFGSTYGMMSASWDPDKEGSLLGVDEFGDNVKAIGEGFRKLSMQDEYEKAIVVRRERKNLLAAKEEKKRELLNK